MKKLDEQIQKGQEHQKLKKEVAELEKQVEQKLKAKAEKQAKQEAAEKEKKERAARAVIEESQKKAEERRKAEEEKRAQDMKKAAEQQLVHKQKLQEEAKRKAEEIFKKKKAEEQAKKDKEKADREKAEKEKAERERAQKEKELREKAAMEYALKATEKDATAAANKAFDAAEKKRKEEIGAHPKLQQDDAKPTEEEKQKEVAERAFVERMSKGPKLYNNAQQKKSANAKPAHAAKAIQTTQSPAAPTAAPVASPQPAEAPVAQKPFILRSDKEQRKNEKADQQNLDDEFYKMMHSAPSNLISEPAHTAER